MNILKVHCKNKKVDPDVDLEYLAKACVGMSGAQLATLVNTAGLRAVQKKKERIDQVIFCSVDLTDKSTNRNSIPCVSQMTR